MKFNLLGLSSVGFLLLSSSIVDARTIASASNWMVKKINAETPYCTLSRQYEGNITFTVAKNKNNEGTLALDFDRNAFDLTRAYPIIFSVGGVSREYVTKAANQSTLIMRAGADEGLFSAMENARTASIKIDEESFDIDMVGGRGGFANFDDCLGVAKPVVNPTVVEKKTVVAPRAPLPVPMRTTKMVNDQDDEINALLEENRRLTKSLSRQTSQASNIEDSAVSKTEIMQLRQQVQRFKRENENLIAQVNQLQSDLIKSRQSLNPDMSNIVAERDKQIAQLMAQNKSLEMALSEAKNQPQKVREVIKEVEVPVIKEVIKEVPILPNNMASTDGKIVMQLAEAETQAKSYEAERDEYRRLLQVERRRMREMGDVAGQIKNAVNDEGGLIQDVRRLEKEKADLVRQLEYAKNTGKVVEVTTVQNPDVDNVTSQLNELSAQLSLAKNQLSVAEAEKKKLNKRMAVIDAEAIAVQRRLAEAKISELADDRPETIQEELEAKTLRSEIAALEAQNNLLRSDMMAGRKEKRVEKFENIETDDKTKGRVSRPVDRELNASILRQRLKSSETDDVLVADIKRPSEPIQIAQEKTLSTQPSLDTPLPSSPKTSHPIRQQRHPQQMVALSGDEIRQLVSESKIPLETSIDRIDRLSGPDFAAFSWDTGMVYGSAEQSRINNVSAFDNSVQQYIQKTAERCEGNFDQNIMAVNTANGLTVKSADIACVDDNATGSAASILFFVRDGMFYAMAHESDMDTFKVAMDMRDRLLGTIDQIF